MSNSPVPALIIERLAVHNDRIICSVALAPGVSRCSTPALAQKVVAAFPDVPRHACVNDRGNTFEAVMHQTSLPHMLEHLVIDLQTRGTPEEDAVFVGTTEWTDSSMRQACVEVSFTDDLVALRAFRDAVDFINDAVVL